MNNKYKLITGIITESYGNYVPKNVPAKILLDSDGHPYAIHRLSDGAGTFLFSKYDRRNTKFVVIK